MPIRPELRPFYRSLKWRAIRARVLARADGICEWCGKPDRKHVWVALDGSGQWWPRGQKPDGPPEMFRYIKVVLTVAHLNHDWHDNRDENLAALCQRCHLAHDRRFHLANARRTRAQKAGQAWLDDEILAAAQPGPHWEARP